MEEFINMIALRFGIDRQKATAIATQLQANGHDLPDLMKGGFTIEKIQGLLGDHKDLLTGIPGVGGMIGNLMGGQAVAEVPAGDAVTTGQENPIGKDPR